MINGISMESFFILLIIFTFVAFLIVLNRTRRRINGLLEIFNTLNLPPEIKDKVDMLSKMGEIVLNILDKYSIMYEKSSLTTD